MSWYLYAVLSTFANAGMFLCFKQLQRTYSIELYLFYTWLFSSIVIGAIYIPIHFPRLNWLLVCVILLAGVASWLGNYAYNIGLRQQPNLGYVEALSSTRIALTFLVSITLLGSEIEYLKLFALCTLVLGVFLVSKNSSNTKRTVSGKSWVLFSISAGVFYAILALFTRFSINLGITAPIFTSLFLFAAAILYGITSVISKKISLPKKSIGLLLVTVLFATFANLFLYLSYEYAPNLAYPVAISNGRMVILYLAALIIGTDKFDIIKGIGVVIVFVSVILLS